MGGLARLCWLVKAECLKTWYSNKRIFIQCQRPGDREESVCCFFNQFRETARLSESFPYHRLSHFRDFNSSTSDSSPSRWKSLVYNVSVSELAVQPVLWAEKAGVALKENMQKWGFKNAVFSGKAFYLNPFRWWALSHEVGNHFLVINEIPRMEMAMQPHTLDDICGQKWPF